MGAGSFSTVIIDAGHGGMDNGGTGNGLREKDLTLDTALRVRTELRRAGLRAVLTREDDHFVELNDRVAFADHYVGRGAVLVSIHYNATSRRSASGSETFFWHANSHGLATRIEQGLVAAAGTENHGVTRRRLRLTRNPQIPCVLVECAYVTNPGEARRAADAGFRQSVARGIATGIVEQHERGDAGIAPVPEIQAPLSSEADARSARSSGGGKRSRRRHH
ncbi:MAG: N-acetylmuramoyl-L-alanine amidase [Verrucomicrobia bacterium]|nr:N-acetylmuramoyl-L-alanine amidase [Verrucomicrobiota bacterium]MBV9658398.1 N-acetylmuramoyl-L-alanine amidase [Verrucomicrobiota bacterium]